VTAPIAADRQSNRAFADCDERFPGRDELITAMMQDLLDLCALTLLSLGDNRNRE
jgi:hypothetical protein